MEKPCLHIVGILEGNQVDEDDLPQKLKNSANVWNRHADTVNSLYGYVGDKAKKNDYKPADFLDAIRGMMGAKFKFCPYCGEKIGWAKIKRDL